MPCSILVSKKTKNCIFWVQKSTKWKIVLTFGYKNDQIKNCTYIWVQKPTKLKIVLTFGFETEQIKNCASNKVGTSTNLRNCTNIVVREAFKIKKRSNLGIVPNRVGGWSTQSQFLNRFLKNIQNGLKHIKNTLNIFSFFWWEVWHLEDFHALPYQSNKASKFAEL